MAEQPPDFVFSFPLRPQEASGRDGVAEMVRRTFEGLLGETPGLGGIELTLAAPPNRYFGGNIMLGDLLVVEDFVDYLKEHQARGHPQADLVVIPSSPFGLGAWGRDLTGRPWRDVERETGVPVALLACETTYE